jgi:hypothetical protein
VTTNDPARQKSKTDQCKYVLTRAEIDEIDSILAANSHIIDETIVNCWEQRFDGAKWTQWGKNQGTGGPVDLVVGYAMNLTRMWQRTKAEYDRLKKQYEDNKD